jgi:hypothetical protein
MTLVKRRCGTCSTGALATWSNCLTLSSSLPSVGCRTGGADYRMKEKIGHLANAQIRQLADA